jgi:hypothetical protein
MMHLSQAVILLLLLLTAANTLGNMSLLQLQVHTTATWLTNQILRQVACLVLIRVLVQTIVQLLVRGVHGDKRSVTGATSVVGTNGATFYITGVQLEVGTQATTFTTAGGSYGAELALCQRYFWRNKCGGAGASLGVGYLATATIFRGYAQFPVAMRSAPTFTINTDWRKFDY